MHQIKSRRTCIRYRSGICEDESMVIWTPKKGFTRCTSRSIWFNCIKRIDRRLDIVIVIATNFTPSFIFYLQIGVCLSLDLVKKKKFNFLSRAQSGTESRSTIIRTFISRCYHLRAKLAADTVMRTLFNFFIHS